MKTFPRYGMSKILSCSIFLVSVTVFMFLLKTDNYRTYPKYMVEWNITEVNRSLSSKVFDGAWIKRTNISQELKTYIDNANMRIGKVMGLWRTPLVRNDNLCGLRYVMSGGLQAQCNASSENPCCNEQIGGCGSSSSFCDCRPHCTDYKNIIQPEFYDWVEQYEPIRNFDMKSSCTYLEAKFSTVTFLGDSLVRHLFAALLIHLTDDPEYGVLKHLLKEKEKIECAYEYQFYERLCRDHLARNMTDIKANPKFCKYTTSNVKFHFEQTYSAANLPVAVKAVKKMMLFPANEKLSLFVIGIGGHNDFQEELVWNRYLLPLINVIYSYRKTHKPFIIWSSGNPNGPIKPVQFTLLQGSARALRFNDAIKGRLKPYNVTIFENFNLAYGVYSFDGSHFGQALNLVKVRLLIKLLRYLV